MYISNSNFEHRTYKMSETMVERDVPGTKSSKMVPVVVSCDYLKIHTTNPYESGYIYGKLLEDKIKKIYDIGAQMLAGAQTFLCDPPPLSEISKMATQINSHSSEETIQELKGLADGASVSYETVQLMNALPIVFANYMGCTALATTKTKMLSADNYTILSTRDRKYFPSEIIKKSYSKTHSLHQALKSVSVSKTIRSKVFDPASLSIDIAMGIENAAELPFLYFSKEMLFGNDTSTPTQVDVSSSLSQIETSLIHNLDFEGGGFIKPRIRGFNLFAENQLILIREHKNGIKTVSLTFPGLLGGSEMMNSKGVAFTVLTQGEIRNRPSLKGENNHLAYHEALTQSKSAEEFLESLKKRNISAPMNLVGCDKTTAFSVEWHKYERNKTCWDYLSVIKD